MTKPKRQSKKPKARTIWVNEYPNGLLLPYLSEKAASSSAFAWGRIACIEFREVLKKEKKGKKK